MSLHLQRISIILIKRESLQVNVLVRKFECSMFNGGSHFCVWWMCCNLMTPPHDKYCTAHYIDCLWLLYVCYISYRSSRIHILKACVCVGSSDRNCKIVKIKCWTVNLNKLIYKCWILHFQIAEKHIKKLVRNTHST